MNHIENIENEILDLQNKITQRKGMVKFLQKHAAVFEHDRLSCSIFASSNSITIYNGEALADVIGDTFGRACWKRKPDGETITWVKTIDDVTVELYRMESFPLVEVPINAWPIMLTDQVLP